jgi:hypothetical protein
LNSSITLEADEIDFGQVGLTNISGKGTLTLQPATEGRDILIGRSDLDLPIPGKLNLSENDIEVLGTSQLPIFIGSLKGTSAIAIDSTGVVFKNDVTLRSPLGSITVDGPIRGNFPVTLIGPTTLNENITTADRDITIKGNTPGSGITTLGNNVTISTGSGSGNLLIDGTVDGDHALTLEAGTGNITVTGAMGGKVPLGNLTMNNADTVTTGAITAASIKQDAGNGTTIFGGALNTDSAEGIDLKNRNFTFNDAVTTTGGGGLSVKLGNTDSLTIARKANMNLDGAFIQTGTETGNVSIAGNISTTDDDIQFSSRNLTLKENVTLNSGTGAIAFLGGLDAGDKDLTLTADEINFGGSVTGKGNLVLQPKTQDLKIAIGNSTDSGDTGTLDSTDHHRTDRWQRCDHYLPR